MPPQLSDWAARYSYTLDLAGGLVTERLASLPGPVCLLCAERRPDDCHRSLIAEWLAGRGWEVEHIV